jgi:hypothetical protein
MISYLKRRLGEGSTWTGFALAVTGAAALATPYSWVAIGCGIAAMLCPQPQKAE